MLQIEMSSGCKDDEGAKDCPIIVCANGSR